MPGDGVISIGATVDKTGVDAGLGSIQEGVQSTVQSIAVQVEETCTRTKGAWNKLSADIKTAAQSVSAESLKVAEATKAQTAALADLRRASVLSKDAKLDDATGTAILAAAQVKVAATSAAVAAAKKQEAAAVASAAEEEALSSNFIVAAFQRAALGVRESCGSIQEKLVETAETGKLSAEGLTAGFAGLGSLLGAGIFVGFAAHFLDETSKMEIELAHLSEKTKIAVEDLSGLQQLVKESGGDWDAVGTGLVRMERALADSKEPSASFTAALDGINLKVADLKGLAPEAQLEKIANAFAENKNAGNQANAAIALFGRGGQALIPILVAQGAALRSNIAAAAKLTGVTKESTDAAFAWQQTTARLSAEFRSVMIPTIEVVEKAIAGLVGTAYGIDAAVLTVLESIGALAGSVVTVLVDVGKAVHDALTGHWTSIKSETTQLTTDLAEIWKSYGSDVASMWKQVGSYMTWQPPKRTEAPGVGDADTAGSEDGGGPGGTGGGSGSGTGSGSRRGSGSTAQAANDPIATMNSNIATVNAEADEAARQKNSADWAAYYRGVAADADALADMQKRIDASHAAAEAASQAQQLAQWVKYYQGISAAATRAQQAQQQLITREQQQFQKMFQAITGPMNTFFDHWLTSGKNMAAAFQKMGDQIAMNFINSEIKMLQHHLQMEVQKRVISMTSNAAQVASTASATAATTALESKAATQSLAKSAAKAAGKAWSALSDIPVVGPALGAAAAAATYAGVMALGVFDQGGIMGHGRMGINLSGADERVLNPQQTQQFEKMVNQSTSTSSSREVHFHDESQWNGVDGASVEGMYKSHAAAGRRQMIRQLRLANEI